MTIMDSNLILNRYVKLFSWIKGERLKTKNKDCLRVTVSLNFSIGLWSICCVYRFESVK